MECKLYFCEAITTFYQRGMKRADWVRISALLCAWLWDLKQSPDLAALGSSIPNEIQRD